VRSALEAIAYVLVGVPLGVATVVWWVRPYVTEGPIEIALVFLVGVALWPLVLVGAGLHCVGSALRPLIERWVR
jgi:hypothetical protein